MWPALIELLNRLAGLVAKAGTAIFAFMAGKSHEKRKQERAEHEATKKELDAERKAADILADPDALERMHNEHRRD